MGARHHLSLPEGVGPLRAHPLWLDSQVPSSQMGQSKTVGLCFLKRPKSMTPLRLASLMFLKHCPLVPTSGPLQWLFPPATLCLQIVPMAGSLSSSSNVTPSVRSSAHILFYIIQFHSQHLAQNLYYSECMCMLVFPQALRDPVSRIATTFNPHHGILRRN